MNEVLQISLGCIGKLWLHNGENVYLKLALGSLQQLQPYKDHLFPFKKLEFLSVQYIVFAYFFIFNV